MKFDLTIKTNEIKEQYLSYSGAYIGAYTYCSQIESVSGGDDIIQFEKKKNMYAVPSGGINV